jgi:hypothetical protein
MVFYLWQESAETTKEICYLKHAGVDEHFAMFQFKCQVIRPFDRGAVVGACEHSDKFLAFLWAEITHLARMVKRNLLRLSILTY